MPQPKAPRAPKPPPPPKPWAREAPGRYRSSDGRFAIGQEGAGRWFLVDEEQRDELGLARTLGPFETLDDAKAGAEEQRSGPTPDSPLGPRLAGSASRRRLRSVAGGHATDGPPRDRPTGLSSRPRGPKPTWIDALPASDARRARGWIEALEELGVAKAEQVVRRDIEGGVPAVATAVLARALARSVLTRPPARALAAATARLKRGGASEEDLAALARRLAEDVVERVLAVVSARERDPDAPPRLPGWRLVEGDGAGGDARRLILSADEVIRAGE